MTAASPVDPPARLALFDLDGTLLDGDTDVLWCDFLVDEGILDRVSFTAANREIAAGYTDGTITAQAFCDFYAATLAGRTAAEWTPLRSRFVAERIVPRLNRRGREALARHRAAGDRVVVTTATNRFLAEPVSTELAVEDLLATELDGGESGPFSGRTRGVLNMREGKVSRLRVWLEANRLSPSALSAATFYSDSINDRSLLEAVGHPVAVNPDPRLAALAAEAGWPTEAFAD